MAKIYLINNQNAKELPLKNLFQKELDKLGFIEDLLGNEEVEILEEKTGQKIVISGLNNEQVKGVWKVNLEMEIAGISSKNTSKTVECALLLLTHKKEHIIYNLHVILIELKQSLTDTEIENGLLTKPSRLQDCEGYYKGNKEHIGKFPASINRIYMLLSLNEHKNDKNYNQLTIQINFSGIIAYKNNIMTKEDGTQLYRFLKEAKQGELLTCKTILTDKDKIKTYFFNKETIDISKLLS
jgi:hypothetical protein